MALRLRYSAISDVGRLRRGKRNQDSGYAGPHLLVVADGMGGGPAGDLASAAALQTLRRLDQIDPADLLEDLRLAVARANERLAELVADDPSVDGMATTVTAAAFDGTRIGLAHIGDSRAYLFRDGQLSRLTADHTFVQKLIDEGRIDEAQARQHPHRSLILRILDGRQGSDPDLTLHRIQPGDRLLLCSDGLCGVVDDKAIAAVLADGTPDSVAVELVQLALAAGGPDNITCVVADAVDEGAADADELGMLLVGAAAEQPRGRVGLDGGSARADTGELPPVPGVDPEQQRYAPRPPQRFGWLRRLAVVAVLLGIAYLAGRVAYDWSQQQYYVGVSGEEVAIYRGVQAQLPGVELSRVYEAQDLPLTALPEYARERVTGGIGASDLDDARSTVTELQTLAEDCTKDLAPTAAPNQAPTQAPTKAPARTTPNSQSPGAPAGTTPSRTGVRTPSARTPTPTQSTASPPSTGSDCAGVSSAGTP